MTDDIDLIRIVYLDGSSYDRAHQAIADYGYCQTPDQPQDLDGIARALAEYLNEWDLGPETDRQAREIGAIVTSRDLHFQPHTIRQISVDGTEYWVQFDTDLQFCCLFRQHQNQTTEP